MSCFKIWKLLQNQQPALWLLEKTEVASSVSGIIVVEHVHCVELAYIGVDRFHHTPRSSNATEEDEFCMKLRKIGGKWWEKSSRYGQCPAVHASRGYLSRGERGSIFKVARSWLGVVAEVRGLEGCQAEHRRNLECAYSGRALCRHSSGEWHVFERTEDCEYIRPLLQGAGEYGKSPYFELRNGDLGG